jgi:hypothetical protein
VQPWEGQVQTHFAYNESYAKGSEVLDIADFDYHVRLRGSPPLALDVGVTPCSLVVVPGAQALRFTARGIGEVIFPLEALVRRARAGQPDDSLPSHRLAAEAAGVRALLVPEALNGRIDSSGVVVQHLTGELYLRWLGRSSEKR